MSWQDISTAPKFWKDILVWGPECGTQIGHYDEGWGHWVKAGTILIDDNGIGMNRGEFERGFLRIAGRSKTAEDRRSPWFKRRYTGEKGIGRLAAHKLGRALQVVSRRWDDKRRNSVEGFSASDGVIATIDWDGIEKLETLAEVAKSNVVTVTEMLKRSRQRAIYMA